MTTKTPVATNHLHSFNHHTGRPRFHFEEGGAAGGAAAGAAGAAGGAAAGAAGAAGAVAWHTGIDAEFIGHAQNKGWKLDDPKEAFVAAVKQAREAEKHFGVPVDRLVKMPAADAKPEDLRAFYERLGAPKEAKEYDLSAVKDPTIAEQLRAAMHERGVPKDAATSIAASFAKALESKAATEGTLDAGKLAEEKTKLKSNWGDKFDYNHLQAIEGARRLGITPEATKALENQVGYAGVMEAMRRIGANTREADFVEGGGPNAGVVTTREGAIARKAELIADKAWTGRWMGGGQIEAREMLQLEKMITGVEA